MTQRSPDECENLDPNIREVITVGGWSMCVSDIFNDDLFKKADESSALGEIIGKDEDTIFQLIEDPSAYQDCKDKPVVLEVLKWFMSLHEDGPEAPAADPILGEAVLKEIFSAASMAPSGTYNFQTKKKIKDILQNTDNYDEYKEDQHIKAIIAEHRMRREKEEAASLESNLHVLKQFEQLLNGSGSSDDGVTNGSNTATATAMQLQPQEIVVLNSKASLQKCVEVLLKRNQGNYMAGLRDYLLECLKLGKPLSEISLHRFFQQHATPEGSDCNPLKGLSALSLISGLLRRTDGFVGTQIVQMYNIQGYPFPFLSPCIDSRDELVWRSPLRAFYPYLLKQRPLQCSNSSHGQLSGSGVHPS